MRKQPQPGPSLAHYLVLYFSRHLLLSEIILLIHFWIILLRVVFPVPKAMAGSSKVLSKH